MAKNLKEFIQCGRDPAYLKNGDIITEELAWEIVGQEEYLTDAAWGRMSASR